RNGRIDRLAPKLFARIDAVDADRRIEPVDAALDVHFAERPDDRRAVGRIDAELENLPGDRAVHRTGIHHDQPEAVGKDTGQGGLAGGGGTVDGDGAVESHDWAGTVSRA